MDLYSITGNKVKKPLFVFLKSHSNTKIMRYIFKRRRMEHWNEGIIDGMDGQTRGTAGTTYAFKFLAEQVFYFFLTT